MPCNGDLVYYSTSSLGIQPKLFNVIQGKSITLQSAISIPSQKQLKLITKDFIEYKPDFETVQGSHLETKIDISRCSPSQYPILQLSEQPLPFEELTLNQDLDSKLNSSNSQFDKNLKIYPNPTRDVLTIEFAESNVYKIFLYDSKGFLLLEKESDENIESLSLVQFSSGIYLLKIYDDQGNQILVNRIIRN